MKPERGMIRKERGYWMFKAPKELKRELDRIRIERIKQGRDNEMKSYSRLGLAIARHQKLLNDLIIADMKREGGLD